MTTDTERDQILRVFRPTGALSMGDVAARDTLSDLVSLAGLVDELSERAFRQLAARPTATAHIGQAREHVALLSRKLRHAEAMLAFNSGQPR
jgi:hypothetical protein